MRHDTRTHTPGNEFLSLSPSPLSRSAGSVPAACHPSSLYRRHLMPPKRSALSNRQFRMLHRGVCTVGQQPRRDQLSSVILRRGRRGRLSCAEQGRLLRIRDFQWCSFTILVIRFTMKEHAALLDSWTAAREPENESYSKRGTKVSTRSALFFFPAYFITVYYGDRGRGKGGKSNFPSLFFLFVSSIFIKSADW